MLCPVCSQTTLLMTERQGVEIDYCPKCRGVWLDRGELDKLIALAAPKDESGSGSRGEPPRSSRSAPERDAFQDEYRPEREYRPEVERPYPSERERPYPSERERPYPSERDRYEQRHPEYHKPKKRESWLGELFDWD